MDAQRASAKSELPRTLVISPRPLASATGTGTLLKSVFANWPRERVANLFSRSGDLDFAACANYFRLPDRPRPAHALRQVKNYLRDRTETADGVVTARLTPRLQGWLDRFAPEVVYSQLGPLWLTRLSLMIAERWHAPLVMHVMDDYLSDWPISGQSARRVFLPAAVILNRANRREFQRACSMASARYCISERMADDYSRRYGAPFGSLHGGADLELWGNEDPMPSSHDGAGFRLLYAGSVLPNTNLASLLTVWEVVEQLAATGVPVSLDIICPEDSTLNSDDFPRRAVRRLPPVSHDAMPRTVRAYDMLLIPFNFDPQSIRFLRNSWPTKAVEYMTSGVPILFFGPPGTAIGDYLANGNLARCVITPDAASLKGELLAAIEARDELTRMAERAQRVAIEEHDIRNTRRDFEDVLCRIHSE